MNDNSSNIQGEDNSTYQNYQQNLPNNYYMNNAQYPAQSYSQQQTQGSTGYDMQQNINQSPTQAGYWQYYNQYYNQQTQAKPHNAQLAQANNSAYGGYYERQPQANSYQPAVWQQSAYQNTPSQQVYQQPTMQQSAMYTQNAAQEQAAMYSQSYNSYQQPVQQQYPNYMQNAQQVSMNTYQQQYSGDNANEYAPNMVMQQNAYNQQPTYESSSYNNINIQQQMQPDVYGQSIDQQIDTNVNIQPSGQQYSAPFYTTIINNLQSNKLMLYLAVATTVVIVLVIGIVLAMGQLKGNSYKDAIAAIDSVKDIALKRNARPRNDSSGKGGDWINSDNGITFFTGTKLAPSETLFKSVSSPMNGIERYDAVINKLTNNGALRGDKKISDSLDELKKTYGNFRKHAIASNKFFTTYMPYSSGIKRMKEPNMQWSSDQLNEALSNINKANDEFKKFKSGDDDFDKLARSVIDDNKTILVSFVKNANSKPSGGMMPDMNGTLTALTRIDQESAQMDTYFNDTIDSRNKLVDVLGNLKNEIVAKTAK